MRRGRIPRDVRHLPSHAPGLEDAITHECPPWARADCQGNPDKNAPVRVFTHEHAVILKKLTKKGCCAPDLGPAPWLCNPGHLGCPKGTAKKSA
jgi:hypothetical protein